MTVLSTARNFVTADRCRDLCDISKGTDVVDQAWRSLIAVEPGKRGGRPCVRGMRITVYDVLSYLAAGMSTQEILDDFPYLTATDVRACLAFAAERERGMFVAVA